MGQNPNRTPSEHSNPHQNRLKWVVHPPQNGTIGFDPQPHDQYCLVDVKPCKRCPREWHQCLAEVLEKTDFKTARAGIAASLLLFTTVEAAASLRVHIGRSWEAAMQTCKMICQHMTPLFLKLASVLPVYPRWRLSWARTWSGITRMLRQEHLA